METVEGTRRLDERSLSRLKWRCRRGLLENDLFIERFFRRHEATLTVRQAEGLEALMALADNDLLDLLLDRRQPEGTLDKPTVHAVLAQLRVEPHRHPTAAASGDPTTTTIPSAPSDPPVNAHPAGRNPA